MAATIQSLFPFTTNKYNDFAVYPCVTEFRAPIQAGQYVFNETTTPPKEFGKLLQSETGIIAGVMISANCAPDDFAQAVTSPLLLQIIHDGNKTPVNKSPFPFSAFAHGDNFQVQWEITAATIDQEDAFLLAVNGAVDQLPGMTQNELILRVAFNYIRANKDKLEGPGLSSFGANENDLMYKISTSGRH